MRKLVGILVQCPACRDCRAVWFRRARGPVYSRALERVANAEVQPVQAARLNTSASPLYTTV